MSSSNLKWVYGPTHRAQDVSNEAVDEYKSIVRQLYLDQNRTREEVLSHLRDAHGFSLSTNQFCKATKRWGFYKQPRRIRTNVQPTESITKAAAPNPPNSLEELFDFEPDILDTIDETEACFETGGDNVADSQILDASQGQFSPTGSHLVSEPLPSINDSQRTLKKRFLTYLCMHHAVSDIDLEERRSLQSVQSYQRRAEDFVLGNNRDTLTQEIRQAVQLCTDIRIRASNPYLLSYPFAHQQFLTLLSSNPAMTRSLASGSSRGSSLNSFRAFQAASRAMETCLKEDQSEYI